MGSLMDGTGTARGGEDARAEGVDPFAWLEDIHGAEALAWVRERNEETETWLQDGTDGGDGATRPWWTRCRRCWRPRTGSPAS